MRSADFPPCQRSPPPQCDRQRGWTAPGQRERSPVPPPRSRCGSPTHLTEEEQDSEEREVHRKEATQSSTGDPPHTQVTKGGGAWSETGEQVRSDIQHMQVCHGSSLPSAAAGLTGSMRETISARSVKEALGQVTT